MAASRECPRCGKPVDQDDRFCRACGAAIGAGEPRQQSGTVVCPSCGDTNSPEATLCRSCGVMLRRIHDRKTAVKPKRVPAGSFFSSWKFVALAAVLLAGGIIIARQFSGNTPRSSGTVQGSRQIDSLREIVQRNPSDAEAVLHLANACQDSRLFQEAIEMYSRYLKIQPADADARVDMGVSYFEMSFMDSTRQVVYLKQARDIIQRALTYAPKHQLALFNLGVIELHLGEVNSAVQWLTKCIQVDSTAEIARRAKELVTQHPFNNQSPS